MERETTSDNVANNIFAARRCLTLHQMPQLTHTPLISLTRIGRRLSFDYSRIFAWLGERIVEDASNSPAKRNPGVVGQASQDWEALIVTVRRGVVHGRLGETKTEASEKPVPLDPELAKEILAHRERSVHIQPTDYVFAADSGNPRWQETILADHIKPAAVKAGIAGKVGWHNFRHTYSTLLRALGTDVKVQQELLRHADVSTTLNIYTQAVSQQKREAASKGGRCFCSG